MSNRNPTKAWLWIVLTILGLGAPVWAQERAPEDETPVMDDTEDPAIEAVLQSEPSTAAEKIRAARILADLGRPELGKRFLKEVLDTKPNQQQLAELAGQFGSPMFVNLAARKELAPEARQLADAVLVAAHRQLRDPKRLADAIARLQDPSAQVQSAAVAELQAAGSTAVTALIGVLADAGRQAEHDNIRAALIQMGGDAIEPLLACLEAKEPAFVEQVIRVLAQLNTPQSAVYLFRLSLQESDQAAVASAAIKRLIGQVPTRNQAADTLAERAGEYLDLQVILSAEADGLVSVWSWDATEKQVIADGATVADASLAQAAQLARDAYALRADDPAVRQLYLTATLEAAAYQHGLDRPLPTDEGTPVAEASRFGVEVVQDLLRTAMADEHLAAATVAAEILGRIGSAEGLLRQGASPSPLAKAAEHPDRRLRLAAVDAIVRLQPAKPFPGSSHVLDSLAFFAATGGTRRALVAGPNLEGLSSLQGTLAQAGYDFDMAHTGRELLGMVIASPDYEVAFIDVGIDRPPIDLLVQQIRRDSRTATLRLGLIARDGLYTRAERIARRDPLTLAFSRPHRAQASQWQVDRVTALAPRRFVSHAQRQKQAGFALDLLAELAESRNRWYDLGRVEDAVLTALYVPKLSTKASVVLGQLNTAEGQQALMDLASNLAQPIEVRQAAAKAFRVNTQQYGLLLTANQIARQYERYNESENQDVGTQRVLGLVLDCIEAVGSKQ